MADFKLSRTSKANLKGVDSGLIKLVERSLKKSEHDFGIPANGGLRTAQEQNNLFHKKPRVTWLDGFSKKSYHQSGKAFDIFIYDEHGACWACTEKYRDVAKVIKAEFSLMVEEGVFDKDVVFSWGGDWTKFKDLPHFQIK
jgi:peptidoglycan L-alanyl-D-glutamate endopeptidase CwlK